VAVALVRGRARALLQHVAAPWRAAGTGGAGGPMPLAVDRVCKAEPVPVAATAAALLPLAHGTCMWAA
jgi:hypothetical protein